MIIDDNLGFLVEFLGVEHARHQCLIIHQLALVLEVALTVVSHDFHRLSRIHVEELHQLCQLLLQFDLTFIGQEGRG